MSFWSVLEKAGQEVEKIFESRAFQEGEQIAGGLITMAFPQLGPLFNLVAGNAKTVEANFAAVGLAKGTGVQKSAVLISSIGNLIAQGLKDAGSKLTIQQYVDYVVGVLNISPSDKAKS